MRIHRLEKQFLYEKLDEASQKEADLRAAMEAKDGQARLLRAQLDSLEEISRGLRIVLHMQLIFMFSGQLNKFC